MSGFKKGQRVAVINSTLSGKFIVEATDAIVLGPEGDGTYAVRIGADIVPRFLDPAAQKDPAAFVASLNALVQS